MPRTTTMDARADDEKGDADADEENCLDVVVLARDAARTTETGDEDEILGCCRVCALEVTRGDVARGEATYLGCACKHGLAHANEECLHAYVLAKASEISGSTCEICLELMTNAPRRSALRANRRGRDARASDTATTPPIVVAIDVGDGDHGEIIEVVAHRRALAGVGFASVAVVVGCVRWLVIRACRVRVAFIGAVCIAAGCFIALQPSAIIDG